MTVYAAHVLCGSVSTQLPCVLAVSRLDGSALPVPGFKVKPPEVILSCIPRWIRCYRHAQAQNALKYVQRPPAWVPGRSLGDACVALLCRDAKIKEATDTIIQLRKQVCQQSLVIGKLQEAVTPAPAGASGGGPSDMRNASRFPLEPSEGSASGAELVGYVWVAKWSASGLY